MKQLKWAIQRMWRGYDDRIKWEFDSYLSWIVVPALKEFCEEELRVCNDENRREIFTKTLQLISDVYKMPYEDWYKADNAETRLWEFFGKNIRSYWN